jgi:hypothetical protein
MQMQAEIKPEIERLESLTTSNREVIAQVMTYHSTHTHTTKSMPAQLLSL